MNNDLINERLLERKNSSDIIVGQTIPDMIKNGTKIFVVGPPRSGTTLIYNIIVNDFFLPECNFISTLMKVFDELYKFSEDEKFNYYAHNLTNMAEIFKKPIYDFLYTAISKADGNSNGRLIYKDPMLTLYMEYFDLFFDSSYKIVFCVRDPRDVVSSMFTVLKKQDIEMEDKVLFKRAINIIFPYYQKIYDIDKAINPIDKDKIIFIKYEDIVTGNSEVIRNLEKFLGFAVNSQGNNENIKGKLDEASPFYSDNYGKAISKIPMGNYKTMLNAEQIAEIEYVFSYHMYNYK